MSVRRVLAILALTAIVALRIEPQLFRLPFMNRASLSDAYAGRADRLWPQYPRFLDGVRAHTHPGDTIAVIVPVMRWNGGYSYAYYRASYFLSGREVLPLADADDHLHPENFRAATYIASWRTPLPSSHFAVVWRGEGGVLMRR